MNFDKNHVARKKSIPTGTRIFRRISLTALKIFLVLLLFCVILGTAAGVGMIKGLIASAPNIDSLSVAPAESATYIYNTCLLYTSDAADEEDSVELGGRRIN